MNDHNPAPSTHLRRWLRRFVVLLFIGYPLGNFLVDFLVLEWHRHQLRSRWPVFYEQFELGKTRLYDQNYTAALTALDRAIATAHNKADFDTNLLAQAYALKGEAHVQLWQYIDAKNVVSTALN